MVRLITASSPHEVYSLTRIEASIIKRVAAIDRPTLNPRSIRRNP